MEPGRKAAGGREEQCMRDEELRELQDALPETSIYVIEEATHRLLYCNRRCRETSGEGLFWRPDVRMSGRSFAPTVR